MINDIQFEPEPEPELLITSNIKSTLNNTLWSKLWPLIKIWIEPCSLQEPHREPCILPLIRSELDYECSKIITLLKLYK